MPSYQLKTMLDQSRIDLPLRQARLRDACCIGDARCELVIASSSGCNTLRPECVCLLLICFPYAGQLRGSRQLRLVDGAEHCSVLLVWANRWGLFASPRYCETAVQQLDTEFKALHILLICLARTQKETASTELSIEMPQRHSLKSCISDFAPIVVHTCSIRLLWSSYM